MNIYSIHDQAAMYFLPPFFAKTDAQAIRMFIGSLGDSFPHRADFNLFRVGKFDENDGTITPETPHKVLAGLSIDAKFAPQQEQAA